MPASFRRSAILETVLICFLISSSTVLAQTNEGILAGTVVDQTGASIEGATVKAVSEATHSTLTTVTGPTGAFRFPSVPLGLWDVTVTHPGFSSETQTGVNVQVSTTNTIKITMSVGATATTVTVEANATRIETASSDIGTVITSQQEDQLPLALGGVGALRSPEAFTFLAPGTSGPGTANSNNGVFISKIGGGQEFGNDVLLDGASILRTENGSSFDEAAPSVEAISEFRVITSTLPAEYGRTTAAIEVFATKSGTNQFHGTAYDILQNDDFNANSWFNNGYAAQCAPGDAACRSKYARPIDKKNDYGVNLGGPVWIPKIYNGKNRTFFFFNWEQYNQHIGGTNQSILPTAAERSGDFSGDLTGTVLGANPCTGAPIHQGEIFDPSTTVVGPTGVPCRTPFAGNMIPASRISTVSKNVLSYLPMPNIPALPSGINYSLSSSSPLNNTTYTIRIDENVSQNDHVFGMYDTRENSRYSGGGTYTLPVPLDPQGWSQDFITHYGRVGWDHIFSPTLLNHLNLGYNRTNSLNYNISALQAMSGNFSWDAKLGITGLSGTNFPIVHIGEGVPNFSSGHDDDNVDNGERFNDNLTWSKGNHSFTFGFDFRNQLYATYAFDSATGVYNFGRAETAADQAVSGQSGNGIASFLLGTVDNGNAFIQGHVPRWTFQYYAGFIEDNWKVSPDLSLNLGIRYSVDMPRIESHNDTSNFDPNLANPAAGNLLGAMIFGSNCNGCNPRWADTKYHDVAPRLGFAFNPHGGRIVYRGGYGIIYGPLQYTDFGGSQTQGYSATPTFTSSNGFNPAFQWDSGFPGFSPPPTLNPSVLNGSNTPDWIQPRFGQPPIVQSWSFQVQGQVSKDMVATVGYVGSRSQNLRSALMNWNNILPGDFALGQALNQPLASNTLGIAAPYGNIYKDWGTGVSVAQALRPYPQYNYIYMDVVQNIGQSTFQSLQATLERHMSAGLSLQAAFTWEKILTDADSTLPATNGGISQIQNPDDLTSEKALSSQDVPYTFTTAFLYQLPFGRGKPFFQQGIGNAILGGWEIGGVLRYQSGTPISFGCSNGIPDWQNCIRFNRASAPPLSAAALNGTFDPFTQRYFNPVCQYAGQADCAFADPNTEPIAAGSNITIQQARGGTYILGDYPRNNPDAFGPNYFNEDLSLIRNFHLFESATIQLKAEFLNAFNRHIFAVPDAADTAPYDTNFGVVKTTLDQPRIVQFTMRLNF